MHKTKRRVDIGSPCLVPHLPLNKPKGETLTTIKYFLKSHTLHDPIYKLPLKIQDNKDMFYEILVEGIIEFHSS